MKKKTRVTISLLSWNGAKYLPWLLGSIRNQTFKDWELIVLDNASTDNSVAVVREENPAARVIQQTRNLGFARGHNLVVNWSNSDYVLVINQDVILDDNFLMHTVGFMEKHPECGSVSGKVMYWDFNESNRSKTIDSFGLKGDRRRNFKDDKQGQKDYDFDSKEVFGLSGAVILFRRQALGTIGWTSDGNHIEYFDEDFFAYKEDVDIAWRLRLAGWQNWIIGTTKAYHHRTVSGGKDLRSLRKYRSLANRMSYRNHLMTLYKNSYSKNLWRDLWPIKWYEFKKFIYLLIFERSTLVGGLEYFKSLPKLRKKRRFIFQHARVSADEMYKWFK